VTGETVAGILTTDPETRDRIANELRGCPAPGKVLETVQAYRQALPGPIEGEALLRAVRAAAETVATQSQETPRGHRRKRMAGFLIDPEVVLRDPAVQGMETKEWAAYARLVLELWRQPDPGVAPDSDPALARLAGMGREEWVAVRPAVQRAFDTTIRPGFWTLSWMVEAHAGQDKYIEGKREAGKRGAQVKAENALKRKVRVRDKQSLSTAQAKVNPSIRVSENPGICSMKVGEGDSKRPEYARRDMRDDGRGAK